MSSVKGKVNMNSQLYKLEEELKAKKDVRSTYAEKGEEEKPKKELHALGMTGDKAELLLEITRKSEARHAKKAAEEEARQELLSTNDTETRMVQLNERLKKLHKENNASNRLNDIAKSVAEGMPQ